MTWVDWLDLASAIASVLLHFASAGLVVGGFIAWYKGDTQKATLYFLVALLFRGGQ